MTQRYIKKWLRLVRIGAAGIATGLLLWSPAAVQADNYGSGTYNNDAYNSAASAAAAPSGLSGEAGSSGTSSREAAALGGATVPASSSTTAESTVIETSSGLQVAINLSDGQAIPSTGYYITVTPLNGQGTSFDKAEIYLDSILAYSGSPDSTGTLRWLWDTSRQPATKVKIVVFGPGGSIATHEFSVTVAPVQSASVTRAAEQAPLSAVPDAAGSWPLWLMLAGGTGILATVVLLLWLIIRHKRGQAPPSLPPAFPSVL